MLKTLRILLRKLEPRVSDDSYLLSLDVYSLYTNIPHIEGVEAIKQKSTKSKPV